MLLLGKLFGSNIYTDETDPVLIQQILEVLSAHGQFEPDTPQEFQHAGSTGPVNHLLGRKTVCPKCGSSHMELRNYDPVCQDADVHCALCGEYVRVYDAS